MNKAQSPKIKKSDEKIHHIMISSRLK